MSRDSACLLARHRPMADQPWAAELTAPPNSPVHGRRRWRYCWCHECGPEAICPACAWPTDPVRSPL